MLKNIGLMTLESHMYNYGGILQEYALLEVLEKLGLSAEIIDFDMRSSVNTFSYKRSLRNLTVQKIRAKLKEKMANQRNAIAKSFISKRHEAFDLFRNKFMKLSKPYTPVTLIQTQVEYECLVCGSDQIWNPSMNIPEFFLDFGTQRQRKVIYAASVGRENLTKRELKIYQQLMRHPDHISVREISAKVLLQPYTEKNISIVLDPTLLLDSKTWKEVMAEQRAVSEKYVFCYYLGETQEKRAAATRFAKRLGLKIVTIPYLLERVSKDDSVWGDFPLEGVGPEHFLRLIHDAEFVLTDSFHASVFSIIFRKDFWVFSRECGHYNMNTRLDTLLTYFDLSDRMMPVPDFLENRPCSYKEKYEIFEKAKEESLSFLKNALGV